MSLSNQEDNANGAWGTIYSQGREHSLSSIENGRSTAWTAADVENYLARVRERAGKMATQLLSDARREAEAIKKKAEEDGYAQGLDNAKAELDDFRSGMGEAVSAVLGAIEGQCSQIFQDWREDIIALARLCVEKVTSIELSENRKAVLEGLLGESVSLLEQRKQLVIRVNPEDEAMLSDIVGLAQERFPDVKAWRVKADSSISPGGMVVESESSLAEGRVESRMAAVESILENLILTDGSIPDTHTSTQDAQSAPADQRSSQVTDSGSLPQTADQEQPAQEYETAPGVSSSGMADAPEQPGDDGPDNQADLVEMQDALPAQTSPPSTGPSEEQFLPGSLPGIDLNDPNLSQDDINAALDAMLAAQDHESNS